MVLDELYGRMHLRMRGVEVSLMLGIKLAVGWKLMRQEESYGWQRRFVVS